MSDKWSSKVIDAVDGALQSGNISNTDYQNLRRIGALKDDEANRRMAILSEKINTGAIVLVNDGGGPLGWSKA